jgi:hypothetical protein
MFAVSIVASFGMTRLGGIVRGFKFWCGVSASSLLGLGLNVTELTAQTAGSRNWTGFYAGSHIGNAAAANKWNSADGIFPNASPFAGQFTGGGIIGGLQAGYNRQFGQVVLGVEADASSADIDGAARWLWGFMSANRRSMRSAR